MSASNPTHEAFAPSAQATLNNHTSASRILVLPEEGLVFDDLQKDLLEQALERARGNKSRAATLLGIHRDQVRYWVKKFQLSKFIQTKPKSNAAQDEN